jgi:hypothetical protein
MTRNWNIPLATLLATFSLNSLYSPLAQATERRFTYTYGSDVLNPGSVEIEPWTTFRLGRDIYYNRLDHRLEFEFGVIDRLQTAWYLNFSTLSKDEASGRVREFKWQGISWEWKYKVLDPVANPIGFALYFEPAFGPGEAAVEGKLILDKRLGNFYGAFNAVFEHEWNFEKKGTTEREMAVEFDLGLAYFLTPNFSAGIEVRNHNEIPAGKGWEHSALFVGPVVSYATRTWWATLTVLPQLPALKKNDSGSTLILDEHERLNARLLFGIHL